MCHLENSIIYCSSFKEKEKAIQIFKQKFPELYIYANPSSFKKNSFVSIYSNSIDAFRMEDIKIYGKDKTIYSFKSSDKKYKLLKYKTYVPKWKKVWRND